MQGLTNAAPPSGGLRIVASGTYTNTGTIALPEPAVFVVVYQIITGIVYRSFPVMRTVEEYGSLGSSDLRGRLSADGLTLEVQGPKTTWMYTAFA